MHGPINIKFWDSSLIGRNNEVLNKEKFQQEVNIKQFSRSFFAIPEAKAKKEYRVYWVVSLLGFFLNQN